MPSASSLPEILTSRRHLAAADVGLAVVVALISAAGFAPAPGVARPAAAAEAPVADYSWISSTPSPASDLPTAVTTATTAPRASVPKAAPTPIGPAVTAPAAQGIPIVALDAYQRAAARQAEVEPGCHLAWTLVAAIGAVESGHGTHAGARLYADGQDLPHVIGPVLDGSNGNARIADTDQGVLDGDEVYDRAVGPMQFIPSTWARNGVDGNRDGRADPFNIVDAAATTGGYLCHGGGDLATVVGRTAAVFSYNHLDSYVATVLALDAAYAGRPVVTTSPSPAAAPTTPAPTAAPTTAGPTPSATPTEPRPTTPTTAPTTATPSPACPTATPTSTPTASPSPSGSPLPSGCPTPSGAPSTSRSASPTTSAGASPSVSATSTPTASATPTPTA